MTTFTNGVSVLVCSYNGSKRITETLHYLASQIVSPEIPWEIIVIDNASTDNFCEVATKAWKSFCSSISFLIISELTPGKENAIERGFAESRYEYVIICDDDNWLSPEYVQNAYILMKNNPLIGMAGGRGIPYCQTDPPEWFYDYMNYYAVGEQNPHTGEVTTTKGFLWGAGAIINKQAYYTLKQANFQRIITYRAYPRFSRAEDIELCLAIKLAGYLIWYDSKLEYQHYISSDKLEWRYLIKLTKEGSLAGPLIRPYQEVTKAVAPVDTSRNHVFRFLLKRNTRLADIRNAISLLFIKNREGDKIYQSKLARYYYFLGILRSVANYNIYYKQVIKLKQAVYRNNSPK